MQSETLKEIKKLKKDDWAEWYGHPATRHLAEEVKTIIKTINDRVTNILEIKDIEDARRFFYINQGYLNACRNILKDLTEEN